MKKILQLVDDEKFTDCIISIFDNNAGFVESDYVILSEKPIERLHWVKSINRVHIVCLGSEEWQRIITLKDYKLVWVHSLTDIKGRFVNEKSSSSKIPVIWSTFGWDYLCFLELPLLGFRSAVAEAFRSSVRTNLSHLCRRILSACHLDLLFCPSWAKLFFTNVCYFSCVLKEEWPLMRRLLGKKANPFLFHYIDYRQYNDTNEILCRHDSKEIWVGNSATATNNFYEVFHLLKRYTDWHINVPLSYGSLSSEINALGARMFKSRWHPIIDFMPFVDFKRKMSKCSVFIFGQRRQQAIGNISLALSMGGCVFLDIRNPAYRHFVENGIVVFTLQNVRCNMLKCLEQFKDQREKNIHRMQELDRRCRQEVAESVARLTSGVN